MKDNTKNTTIETACDQDVNKTHKNVATCQCQSVIAQENKNVEHSVLITSLLVNLFFLIGWVVVTANSDYAHTLGRVIYNL